MNDQDELIKEEQEILDRLIDELDGIMLDLNKDFTRSSLQAKKAKDKSLPDTYGILISTEHTKKYVKNEMKTIQKARNELYDNRLIVECDDGVEVEEEEIKVGLHSLVKQDRVYIMSWLRPVCRHYVINNSEEDFEDKDKGNVHYKLKMRRKVDIFFDQVTQVTHLYPLNAKETEKILSDEFLQELLKRRVDSNFRNIVFSIQKQQGKIIQTPFQNNLIVQGCAGSGKSMIMLHRLPIILYDNPNSLDRNNLFIITPSLAYIQMANDMRIDLEIEDLKMGTIEQYYDYVIQKSGRTLEVYGKKKAFAKLTPNQEAFIYSDGLVREIHYEMERLFSEGYIDIRQELQLFGLTKKTSSVISRQHLFRERIMSELLSMQEVLNENNKVLWLYHSCMREGINNLEQLARMLNSRKSAVLRKITQMISVYEDEIIKVKKELKKLDMEKDKVKYSNRINKIRSAQKKIIKLRETQEIVELDDSYFESLEKIGTAILSYLVRFVKFRKNREEVLIQDFYSAIAKKDELYHVFNTVVKQINNLSDKYVEWADSINEFIRKIAPSFEAIDDLDSTYLSEESYNRLNDKIEYFTELLESIIHIVYTNVMKKLGQCPDEKGNIEALNCSSYIYLQILYSYQGAPNTAKETLIMIDEAQSVAPQEYRLINAVNDNKVILNLFGDVKQHIEGTKGIDNWNEIQDYTKYKLYQMRENYRNARQITEYCNRRFNTQMRAINLDGSGVHEFTNRIQFEYEFNNLFRKPMNPGTSGIIVKNREEVNEIMKLAEKFKDRIHDMINEGEDININKWNLLTVEQAKGLEFGTVFAVTGRMGMNEKYISYTRALNELYVYDFVLDLTHEEIHGEQQKEIKTDEERTVRRKREKRKSNDDSKLSVKDFFVQKGMIVIDLRKSTGLLWVIGEKSEIELIINEAISNYGISGVYGSDKTIQFRQGWYTKTRK